jgi:dolichol-phosphate mannosyltransferase
MTRIVSVVELVDNPSSDVAVVLPTYCEAENIERLVHTIEDLDFRPTIVVMDDSSPDGTGEIVKKLQEAYPNVILLCRPAKAGLGTAITDCFRFILTQPNPPKHIITMDADYSHNPQDIPRLLQRASEHCDVVIGSRYCKGGKVKGWNLRRLVISKVANKLTARLVALPINDLTSGFRCYSREYIQRILPELHSETYEIQIETLRQASIRKAKVTEIPITFTNRKMGKSKLTKNEILSFFLYVLKTATKNSRCSRTP